MPTFGNEATLIPSSPWSLRILVAYSFILTLSLCTFAILYPFHAFLNAPQLWPVVKSPLFPVRSSDMLFMLLRRFQKDTLDSESIFSYLIVRKSRVTERSTVLV